VAAVVVEIIITKMNPIPPCRVCRIMMMRVMMMNNHLNGKPALDRYNTVHNLKEEKQRSVM
jgi:hypothetical protein